MRTLTIEYGDGVPYGFDVVNEYGERCNGLAFEEMLRQVIELTHPRLPEPRCGFRMQTAEDWSAQNERSFSRSLVDDTDYVFGSEG